jgi:hypothetical protein
MKTVFVTWLSLNPLGTMPRWTERQQEADEIHNTFFAGIIAEIAGQLQKDDSEPPGEPSARRPLRMTIFSTGMNTMSDSDKSSSSSSTSSSDLSMVDSDSDEESLAVAQYIVDMGHLFASHLNAG